MMLIAFLKTQLRDFSYYDIVASVVDAIVARNLQKPSTGFVLTTVTYVLMPKIIYAF